MALVGKAIGHQTLVPSLSWFRNLKSTKGILTPLKKLFIAYLSILVSTFCGDSVLGRFM